MLLKKSLAFVLFLLFKIADFACYTELPASYSIIDGHPEGWEKLSHSKGEEPNYNLLFDDLKVHVFEIEIANSEFLKMQQDLDSLLDANGFDFEDPIYVEVTIRYGGRVWYRVGLRWKGNSSLKFIYSAGEKKFPIRLKFDYFEDVYKEIKNQRIHGFQKITFSNNWCDMSFIHDQLIGEIYRDRGVPANRATQAAVFINVVGGNQGKQFYGIYTMAEDLADEMIQNQQFAEGGTLYKPDGNYWETFEEKYFEKKTNEDDGDFSEVKNAVDTLNSALFTTNKEQWRKNLEAVFDVDFFLNWLAVTNAFVNWDTYGWMTHNYYVYADPCDNRRLKWIPWDSNLGLQTGRMFSSRNRNIVDPEGPVWDSGIQSDWIVIKRIMADPIYKERYKEFEYLSIQGLLSKVQWEARVDHWHNLISPYIATYFDVSLDNYKGEFVSPINEYTIIEASRSYLNKDSETSALGIGLTAFENSHTTLKEWITKRRTLIEEDLNGYTPTPGFHPKIPIMCDYTQPTGIITGNANGLIITEIMYHPMDFNSSTSSVSFQKIGNGYCRGVEGVRLNAAIYEGVNGTNSTECINICNNAKICLGISHHDSLNRCIVYYSDCAAPSSIPTGFSIRTVQNPANSIVQFTSVTGYQCHAKIVVDLELNDEFIEFKNVGNQTLNLGEVNFLWGIQYTFPANTMLEPGKFALLVKDKAAMQKRYNSITNAKLQEVTGTPTWRMNHSYPSANTTFIAEYQGVLSNGGELIIVQNAERKTILEYYYDDDWYKETDGKGYSLVISNSATLTQKTNSYRIISDFSMSKAYWGTPGEDDTLICPPTGCIIPTRTVSSAFSVTLSMSKCAVYLFFLTVLLL